MRNAAVLPVPVCDCTWASVPARVFCRVASCTGVHSVKPASSIPRITQGCRFNSVNFILSHQSPVLNIVNTINSYKHYFGHYPGISRSGKEFIQIACYSSPGVKCFNQPEMAGIFTLFPDLLEYPGSSVDRVRIL